jgi:hypothetical protein
MSHLTVKIEHRIWSRADEIDPEYTGSYRGGIRSEETVRLKSLVRAIAEELADIRKTTGCS